MAVSEDFTLPAQPTSGSVVFVPLGGDGFTAPRFAYMLNKVALTGDVSGGAATITARMDLRFVSLVSYVTGQIQQGTSADAEHRFTLSSDFVAEQVSQGDITAISSTIAAFEIAKTWFPAPVLLPGGNLSASERSRIIMKFLNVDDDVYEMAALIYCFDIRVREETPMGPLLWARGAT